MSPGLLAGRHALVTGGARGLGAAVVRRFAAEGASGAVIDRDAPDEALPPGWAAVAADVADERAITAAVAEGVGTPPRVDVLVAAAGIVPGWASIAEQDLAVWDDVLRVNARGVLATLRAAAPHMGEGASVVVIASLNAWRADPNIVSYVASKHAALGIVRSAALDLGRHGVRVNALGPGPVATEALLARMAVRERERGTAVADALADAARATALGRIATTEEVAAAALFLAADLSSAITGHLLPVDCGML